MEKYQEYRERAKEALKKYWRGADNMNFALAIEGAGEMADLLDEIFNFDPEELEED